MKTLAFLLGLLLSASLAAAEEIRILNWSDYIDPEIPKQFEKATGIKVQMDLYEETEAMVGKLRAGGDAQYDLVVASDHAIVMLTNLKLLQKIDAAKLPNLKNIDKPFLNPPYDPQNAYSVPYLWGTVGIVYNKKKLPNFEPSWGMMLDPAKSGSFVLLDSMRDVLGAALRFQGHSVNSVKPDELRQAGKAVLAAKKLPRCQGFDGSPAACKKVITGQADMALVFNGDALNAMKEDKDQACEYVVPKEGSIIWVDTMVIPTKAPNADGAHKFINYLLDAKVGAQLANFINYATPNAAALPLVDEKSRKDPRIYPTPAQIKTLEYLHDVGKDTNLYDEIWTAIKAR